ncbi:glycosyl hydrolase [Paenibacillus sp. GCM10027626]|uniref:glycosyl hydrolase n=1 Tax=Paenibacillus sp. GCM10027626 TaxID=3273411 RepID=UPI00362656AB
MYNTLKAAFSSKEPPRSIAPLLWYHGEEQSLILEEIARMDEMGCGGFVIESRPHRDYLGKQWWDDLQVSIAEAKRRGMEVWIFDEEFFPSGIAGGRVLAANADYRQHVLVERRIDVCCADGEVTIPLEGLVLEGDTTIAILACKIKEDGTLHEAQMLDLTADPAEGKTLRITGAAQGQWRIMHYAAVPSFSGRSHEIFVDLLRPEVTDAFIEITYEETYRRFGDEFGGVIKGFFGDETGFENYASYDLLFGETVPSLPWTARMLQLFEEQKGYSLKRKLPALWHQLGEDTEKVRHDYMDVLTTLFAANFFGRIQKWCHDHGVQFIGHIVEDNGAHAHHGYGPGHFFRALQHFDMGGYDLVAQVIPGGQTEGFFDWGPWKQWNAGFFYWTMAKLADSATNLYNPESRTMCENFGAYGWCLGLRWMKWLSDWQIVRGTDYFVPHAFDPLFPDRDCPPHFYAQGHNPQWRFWRAWSDYVNRSTLMLQGGRHKARVGLLYHAESEWAGGTASVMPLDAAARQLLQGQIDFEFIPYDELLHAEAAPDRHGTARIRQLELEAIVVPAVKLLPVAVLAKLHELVLAGVSVIVLDKLPSGDTGGEHNKACEWVQRIWGSGLANATVCQLSAAADWLRAMGHWDLAVTEGPSRFPLLQYYAVEHKGLTAFFINNEHLEDTFDGWVTLRCDGAPELWQPLDGSIRPAAMYRSEEGAVHVKLRLAPYQSLFIVVHEERAGAGAYIEAATFPELLAVDLSQPVQGLAAEPGQYEVQWSDRTEPAIFTVEGPALAPVALDAPWRIAKASAKEYPQFTEVAGLYGAGDLNKIAPLIFDSFSGTAAYRQNFHFPHETEGLHVELDLGEAGETVQVILNGKELGVKLCPPYRYHVSDSIRPGSNELEIRVTNTLHSEMRDPYSAIRFPFGLLGPVRIISYYRVPLK